MAKSRLNQRDHRRIEAAIARYSDQRNLFEAFAEALTNYFSKDGTLKAFIHFIKFRTKEPDHLRDKLVRKTFEGDEIGAENLFERITDLAGVRIIHLHTEQLRDMHSAILAVLDEYKCVLVEPPTANCWDNEFEAFFKSLAIETKSRASMYTTVHYVVRANQRTPISCEIQVRTLMDEVWGEVSHRVNYPHSSPSESCQDQLKVLARLTTGCARLVDSIFRSHQETINHKKSGANGTCEEVGQA